jgi:transcriptional regulator with XRE-family HTH domain
MSLTLGEKLRQAREAKGISVSEVAEQTRISPLYIQSIENNDYKPLPGGIFNKGFVKSYAKFIGVDEQEALADYSRLAAEHEATAEQPFKVYRPEVLTDDNAASSMAPTLIFAGIILALMTGGILFVLNYLQNRDTAVVNTNSNSGVGANIPFEADNANVSGTAPEVPTMSGLKVDFRAATDEIWLSSSVDGREADAMVAAGSGVSFEPKESIRLSYAVSRASSARLLINGRQIQLPDTPTPPRRNVIQIEINKDNIARIWREGRIAAPTGSATGPSSPAAGPPSVTGTPSANPTRPPATPRPSPANRPQGNRTPANAVPRSSPN